MSGFTPLSPASMRTILVNQFQASLTAAGVPLTQVPDTGPDSVIGANFDALVALGQQLQFQAIQDGLAARLATSPPNADGTVSPDVAAATQPFGFTPAGGSYATSNTFLLQLPSVSAVPIIIPCGYIIQRGDGIQYILIADATQPDYNGNQGYTIPPNTGSFTGTFMCLTQGSIGNVANPANTTWQPYTGVGSIPAPSIGSVSNSSAISNGANGEQQTAYLSRFTTGMQNGKWGTETAIIAAALGVQAGLIVSYGDCMTQAGVYQRGYFTLIVNQAGSATAPSQTLLTNIKAAILSTRSGGIGYLVLAPQLITPIITGTVAVYASSNQATVGAAVATAVQNAVNAIGLSQSGGTTTLSYAQTLALMIGIPGVNPVGTSLSFNNTTSDLTAPFGSQLVCPSAPTFTTT